MKKNKKSSKKSKQHNKILVFSGMAFQMGAIIGLGAWGGVKLDEKFQTGSKIFTISLSLASIFIAMYLVIRDVLKMQKDND
jgi:MFS-type transporter involved in bile tolerance (Atg22 family)